MTSFLTDENIPPAVAEFLRQKGFDVKEAREVGTPGISDSRIIELARREERVLVTFKRTLIVLEREGYRVRRST